MWYKSPRIIVAGIMVTLTILLTFVLIVADSYKIEALYWMVYLIPVFMLSAVVLVIIEVYKRVEHK